MSVLNILVACEESQAVTIELRKLGHNAFSCDIEPCSGGNPEWHIQGDVLPLLNGRCEFNTVDGTIHSIVDKWDMIIAFPPCTYLTPAGACNIPKDPSRITKGWLAKEFFMKFYNSDCDKIAIENPPPMKRFEIPKYSQIIQPYEFGEPVSKKTAIWVKGLPTLKPTNNIGKDSVEMVEWEYQGKRKSCSKWYNRNAGNPKARSKTFQGIAKAMAEQWT